MYPLIKNNIDYIFKLTAYLKDEITVGSQNVDHFITTYARVIFFFIRIGKL